MIQTAVTQTNQLVLRSVVYLYSGVTTLAHRTRSNDRGQSTAEYALVILGAAAVALLVVAWAGKTNKISKLLDAVLDSVTSRFS